MVSKISMKGSATIVRMAVSAIAAARGRSGRREVGGGGHSEAPLPLCRRSGYKPYHSPSAAAYSSSAAQVLAA